MLAWDKTYNLSVVWCIIWILLSHWFSHFTDTTYIYPDLGWWNVFVDLGTSSVKRDSLPLKGKFSSGIEERSIASTLNRDFNWKQLSKMILWFFFFFFFFFLGGDVFKVYLSNIDSETAEKRRKKERRLWILGVGAAIYYDLKYNR